MSVMTSSLSPVHTLLMERAQLAKDNPFLVVPSETGSPFVLSYGKLYNDVERVRTALAQSGIHAEDRVGLQLGSPQQFVVAWLALLTMGAVAVPLATSAPATDVLRTLSRISATTLVQNWDQEVRIVSVPADISIPPATHHAYDGGGVILWTSGSTGEPKPVGIQTHALLHTANQVRIAHQLTDSDIGYSPLPLFHVNAEVVALLASFLAGGTIVIPERFHRTTFWDEVLEHRVTWINAVPSILSVVARDTEGPLRNLSTEVRFVRSASMPLAPVTAERWEERWGLRITETYGLSEAASQVTANSLEPEDRPRGSAGLPRGLKLRVVNEMGQCLPPHVVGGIEIRGQAVINPLWGPNQWAAEKFRDGWYRTGDLGYLDEQGHLYLKGRMREVINRGGEKIFPREIEEVVCELPAVQECAVVGAPHPILGEEVVLFIVARDNAGESVVDIVMEHAKCMLAPYKVPSRVLLVSSLPTGPTGKLAKRRLEARLAAEDRDLA